MASLERLATRHRHDGLVVLAVNYKEPVPTIRRVLDLLPFGLPILLGRDGEAAGAWTPRVFPSTVPIGRGGASRGTVIGELDWMGGTARERVAPLLPGRAEIPATGAGRGAIDNSASGIPMERQMSDPKRRGYAA